MAFLVEKRLFVWYLGVLMSVQSRAFWVCWYAFLYLCAFIIRYYVVQG